MRTPKPNAGHSPSIQRTGSRNVEAVEIGSALVHELPHTESAYDLAKLAFQPHLLPPKLLRAWYWIFGITFFVVINFVFYSIFFQNPKLFGALHSGHRHPSSLLELHRKDSLIDSALLRPQRSRTAEEVQQACNCSSDVHPFLSQRDADFAIRKIKEHMLAVFDKILYLDRILPDGTSSGSSSTPSGAGGSSVDVRLTDAEASEKSRHVSLYDRSFVEEVIEDIEKARDYSPRDGDGSGSSRETHRHGRTLLSIYHLRGEKQDSEEEDKSTVDVHKATKDLEQAIHKEVSDGATNYDNLIHFNQHKLQKLMKAFRSHLGVVKSNVSTTAVRNTTDIKSMHEEMDKLKNEISVQIEKQRKLYHTFNWQKSCVRTSYLAEYNMEIRKRREMEIELVKTKEQARKNNEQIADASQNSADVKSDVRYKNRLDCENGLFRNANISSALRLEKKVKPLVVFMHSEDVALTMQTISSLGVFRHRLLVIDNSPRRELYFRKDVLEHVHESLNAAYEVAKELRREMLIVVENNVRMDIEADLPLLDSLERLPIVNASWSHFRAPFDTLVGLRLTTAKPPSLSSSLSIPWWDSGFLGSSPLAGSDLYRRIEMADIPHTDFGHIGISVDEGMLKAREPQDLLSARSKLLQAQQARYQYAAKWGGSPTKEKFVYAYNINPDEAEKPAGSK